MPNVKIKELPIKRYAEMKLTDLMVLEDTSDTKQITVQDLKLFFSSDEKLEAIIDQMNTTFDELRDYIDTHFQEIIDTDRDLERRINNLFEDHEDTKRRLGKMREELTDAQNDIVNIQDHLKEVDSSITDLNKVTSDHEKRLIFLEKDNATNKENILKLQQDNEMNKKNISKLQQDLVNLSTHVDEEVKRLDGRITTINNENHDYTDKAYDNLMKYIDYYHHVHENPPNFDEPYKGDPQVAAYIHPVGTVFNTSDSNFDINKWFPGTWKYVGVGAAFAKDGTRAVDMYTYVRIE